MNHHPDTTGMQIKVQGTGLLVASFSIWDGTAWRAVPLAQQYGPSPLASLFGVPIRLPGDAGSYRRKSFRELFYDSFSDN
jgi:hypothetical protein